MGIRRPITFIALILAGIRLSDSVSAPYRYTSRSSLRDSVNASHAFILPGNRYGRQYGEGVGKCSTKNGPVCFVEQNDASQDGILGTGQEDSSEIKEPSRIYDDREDSTTIHDELERKSIDYIDQKMFDTATGEGSSADSSKSDKNSSEPNYFNWNKVRDNKNLHCDEIVKSIDSTGSKELEKGRRPIISGRGTDMKITVEEYPTNVDTGRINEWVPSWVPGEKVLSFFPILIDEYSLLPSPLQLGFEEPVTFRGKHVDMTFNSLLDTITLPGGESKQIYGMCFINPSSGQLAPLAIYAELISREAFVDGGGERLKVTGRVLGRVILHQVVMEEPFIKARVLPIEDNPHFTNADEVPKLVDEITTLHGSCNKIEMEMMELLNQPYAVARIKSRPNLHDLIDERLNHFNVDLGKGPQAFAQIAAYTAFDYHMTAEERYDALVMQDSFDRLRYVRDCLRMKLKQLNVLKKAPREKLDGILEQMREMQLNREEAFHQAIKEGEESADK